MTEIKYFVVGIFFSILLMLSAEVVYGEESPIEIIAYANDAVVTMPLSRKPLRALETLTTEKNNESFAVTGKTTSTEVLQTTLNSEIVPMASINKIVTGTNNKIAMLEPARPRILSSSQMNEAGAKMLRRFLVLPMMYSNIRKK